MHVEVMTDHNIEGQEALTQQVRDAVEDALSRVGEHITRVQVQLSDETSHKNGGKDKRCMMEARLAGRRPIAVTHHAETLEGAVYEAADKLGRLIENTMGRVRDKKRQRTDPPLVGGDAR